MGICSSCLGRGRRDDYEEDDERLLFDDPNGMPGYGSFAPQHQTQDDIETRREMESLQRVVAQTADNMVDIFEIAAPSQGSMASAHAPPMAPFIYATHGARAARYQHLAARLSAGDNINAAANLAVAGPASAVDWISTDDEDEYDYDVIEMAGTATQQHTLKLPDKPLVGTFADAAAAMGREG